MTVHTSRRAFLALAAAPAALLAACGSSSIESPLTPTRFLGLGDGFSDLGQGSTGTRYTVNDDTTNIWAAQVAASYGLTLTAKKSGGTSFAQGGARISATTGETVPSLETQITTLLGDLTIGTFSSTDVILIGAGIADIVAEVKANGISTTTTTQVQAAGTALGTQVRRLVTAGASYVVVAGVYWMGLSPWAVDLGQEDAITELSKAFNKAFEVSVVDLGAHVFYIDTARYINLVYNTPSSYGLNNVTSRACTTTDASTCTNATLDSTLDVNKTLFADSLYFTPVVHRLFGTWAYNALHNRW